MPESSTGKRIRKRRNFLSGNIGKYLVLAVFGFLVVYPFILILSISFEQTANLSVPFPPRIFPAHPSLFNYRILFMSGGIGSAYLNSLIVMSGSVLLKVSSALLAGYAFAKGNFAGKRILFTVFLATLMIPVEARLISLFLMWNKVHLLNSFWPLILPSVIDAFMVFLAKQFFEEMPDSLGEAARIDGCNEFQIFTLVYLPLAGPVTATMAILAFMSSWHDFLWPLIVLTSEHLRTLPLFMAAFSVESGGSYAGLAMAVVAVSSLPVLVLYLFFQRYIIRSVAMSGLK